MVKQEQSSDAEFWRLIVSVFLSVGAFIGTFLVLWWIFAV